MGAPRTPEGTHWIMSILDSIEQASFRHQTGCAQTDVIPDEARSCQQRSGYQYGRWRGPRRELCAQDLRQCRRGRKSRTVQHVGLS